MEKTIVTIIAPCYNGEKCIEKFLDSVLEQTYSNIELVLVNDGSTDKTEEVIKSYTGKFDKKGIKVVYVYKENGGQASAINEGLKYFKGDYLMWIDSDDIMMPDNIRDKIDFLQQNPDCGFVLGKGVYVKANDNNKICGYLQRQKPDGDDKLFEDLIFENNVIYGPGTIMVRREAFLKAIPDLTIFESKEGQNWQMMLPLAYYCKCGYLDKVVFKCVLYENSHSRKKRNFEQRMERLDNFEILLSNTIDRISEMPLDEKVFWKNEIKNKYIKRKLELCYEFHRLKKAREIRKTHGIKEMYVTYWVKNIANKISKRVKKYVSSSK